jgi:molybdopterin synthase catalytic subunit
MANVHIAVQTQDFNLANEIKELKADVPEVGALVTFTGLVRDFHLDMKVSGLFLEHYPGMTEKVLAETVAVASQRWPLISIRLVHRVGELEPGDQIVFVGVSSAHRGDAFAACEYLIDTLKTSAPFWKKERSKSGSRWVDAKLSDNNRAKRWKN